MTTNLLSVIEQLVLDAEFLLAKAISQQQQQKDNATEPAPIDRKENARQNGLTATTLMNAPLGASYVWCNNELWYPIELCKKLRRPDIRIHWPRWLDTNAPHSVRGQVIVDHALRLTPEQRELINHINKRNKK